LFELYRRKDELVRARQRESLELLSADAGVQAQRGESTEFFISGDAEVQAKWREIKRLCLILESQFKDRSSREAEVLEDTAPHRSFN
jgi:hypothetical protein